MAHPWPYQDSVGTWIIEGWPRRGVATPAVISGAARAIVLAFPLPVALTLAFATFVGGGGRRGRGHRMTRRFLLWWVWRQ
jgi:hypothetical protein